ncbi:hypothetical protein [Neorickettsia sennetsu]|uniref:Uncharacterized protein n=1 Tax=Ehrlichia sennetsu (strain ATCC VR-367 / Miyayama) TaxID=222891 RepID=Q2GDL3_EHRS3|nr:hypothetical protein [Neorickettsia sennetsu]ABD45906.1 hypothetical protein NSE_0550 [Neorickettsia sennetsu str. Miyayama]
MSIQLISFIAEIFVKVKKSIISADNIGKKGIYSSILKRCIKVLLYEFLWLKHYLSH